MADLGDYKYWMQERAEEIADAEYGKEFYELPDDLQYEIFNRARRDYGDAMADRADYLRDIEKERR